MFLCVAYVQHQSLCCFFLQGDSKILLCAQCEEAIIPLHQIRMKLFFIVMQWDL
jgi:hypothetical protein